LAKITYDEVPHSHVVNTSNIGVFAERNAKKVGKVKIEEKQAKTEQMLEKKGKEGWYGRLPEDKKKEIINSRTSKEKRQKIATEYILKGK
jgi:hypothetical protein